MPIEVDFIIARGGKRQVDNGRAELRVGADFISDNLSQGLGEDDLACKLLVFAQRQLLQAVRVGKVSNVVQQGGT